MSKHTKGPWVSTVIDGNLFGPDNEIVSAGSFDAVGSSMCIATLPSYKTMSDSEKQANANLIAAAPEMLQALKVAIKRLEEIRYQIASDKQIDFLNAVIANAEGRK